MKRRHTIGGFGGGGGGEKGGVVGLRPGGRTERDILKERLQREIAEDYAVDMEEGEGEREAGGEVELHTLTSESEDEKKEEVRSGYTLGVMTASLFISTDSPSET